MSTKYPLTLILFQISKSTPYKGSFSQHDPSYELDTAYRILADHSRMITACLADGMFPNQNHKLRKIIRKSLMISDKSFKIPGLLNDLIPVVVEILGDTYPEMGKKINQIQQIISHENESLRKLRTNLASDMKNMIKEHPKFTENDLLDYPGFMKAYRDIRNYKVSNSVMNGEFIYKMYDTFGLDEEILTKIVEIEGMKADFDDYEKYSKELKANYKANATLQLQQSNFDQLVLDEIKKMNIRPTRNEYKYNYAYNNIRQHYEIPLLKTKILAIINENKLVNETPDNRLVYSKKLGTIIL